MGGLPYDGDVLAAATVAVINRAAEVRGTPLPSLQDVADQVRELLGRDTVGRTSIYNVVGVLVDQGRATKIRYVPRSLSVSTEAVQWAAGVLRAHGIDPDAESP